MNDLILEYLKAKGLEDAAKAKRVELGAKIAAELGHPAEGQKTHRVGDYKVSVKGVMNRKVDWDAFDAIEGMEHPPVKIKREIDLKGLEWYAQNSSDTHAKIIDTITTTPGRPQITIKEG